MPDPFHKSHFLDAIYPQPWIRLGDVLPKELASFKMASPLSLSLTPFIFRVQICCSIQIADFASQVTNTHLNTRGIGGEEIGVVRELIVIEAVFPIVELCFAFSLHWFEAHRGKICIGTSVGYDVS